MLLYSGTLGAQAQSRDAAGTRSSSTAAPTRGWWCCRRVLAPTSCAGHRRSGGLDNLAVLPFQPFAAAARWCLPRPMCWSRSSSAGRRPLGAVQGAQLPLRRPADPGGAAAGQPRRPRCRSCQSGYRRRPELNRRVRRRRRGGCSRTSGLRLRCGENARAFAETAFDIDQIADRFEAIFAELVPAAGTAESDFARRGNMSENGVWSQGRRLHRRPSGRRPAGAGRTTCAPWTPSSPTTGTSCTRTLTAPSPIVSEPGACREAMRGVDACLQPGRRHGRNGLHRGQQGPVHAERADQHAPADRRPRGRRRQATSSRRRPACTRPSKQTSPDVTALKESDAYPAMPEDGYGWEKLFSERMCRHFNEDFGLETRVARYHNVYGPHGTYDGGREKAPAAICRKVIEAKLSGKHRDRDLGRRPADAQLHVHRRLRGRHRSCWPMSDVARAAEHRQLRARHDQPIWSRSSRRSPASRSSASTSWMPRRASAGATATTP